MTPVFVCRIDDIAEGSARGFVFGEGASQRDIIVLRTGGDLRAYVNSCPHQRTPLETFPDKFLNEDGTLLVCSTHGARFRVGDGVCVSGPCIGKALTVADVAVRDGGLYLRGALK